MLVLYSSLRQLVIFHQSLLFHQSLRQLVEDLLGQMAPSAERELPATCAQTQPPTGQAKCLLLADLSLAGEVVRSVEVERRAIHAAVVPTVPGFKLECARASKFQRR